MTSISSFYFANSFAPVGNTATPATPTIPENKSGASAPSARVTEKPFPQIILDARSALDAGYAKVGGPADFATSVTRWESIGINNLDRRSLYAISSNQGNMFSQVEVDAAKYFMSKQQEVATALADPNRTNPVALYKAGIDFLDNVSPEEKGSLEWAQSRASNQWAYEHHMRARGKEPENVDSGNLIVRLYVRAYDELSATNNASLDPSAMPSWLKATDLWHLQNETSQSLSWYL